MVCQEQRYPDWEEARTRHEESAALCTRLLVLEKRHRNLCKVKSYKGGSGYCLSEVRSELATAKANLAIPYENLHHPEYAERTLKESQELRDPQDLGGLADTFNCFGRLYQGRQDWQKAEYYFEKRRETLEEKGDLVGLARVYNSLGYVCFDWARVCTDPSEREDRLKKARDSFYQALVICWNDVCDPVEKVQAMRNLAILFSLQQKNGDAAKMLKAILAHQLDQGKPPLLNWLGYLYESNGDWDIAEGSYSEALRLATAFNDWTEEQAARRNLDRIRMR